MGQYWGCGLCRCCRRPPRSSTPSGWKATWSGSPTNATGHLGSQDAGVALGAAPSSRAGRDRPAGQRQHRRRPTDLPARHRRHPQPTPRPCPIPGPVRGLRSPSGQVNQALDVLGCQAEVISLDPSSLEEVLDGVLQVGKAAGAEQRAHEVVAGLRDRLASVQGAMEGLSGPGCSPWSGAIRRTTAGTGCQRCCRLPVASRCWPVRVPCRCG